MLALTLLVLAFSAACGLLPALYFHSAWWLLACIPGLFIGGIWWMDQMCKAVGLGH